MMKKFGGYIMLMRVALTTLFFVSLINAAYARVDEAPIVTDNRIKTLVYNENEVFKLVMHYGFQSHIVFDKNEVIETVSVGDSYAWKITPVENRIFIKPLEQSSYTNMTVVTDKRTYQFDLVSKLPKENLEDGLVYMVRFYYPSGNFDMPHLAAKGGSAMPPLAAGGGVSPAVMYPPSMSPVPTMLPPESMSSPNSSVMPSPEPMPSMMGVPPVPPAALSGDSYPDYKGGGGMSQVQASRDVASAIRYNFDYTLTGPETIAPQRVFDDGKKTYFEFPANTPVPYIAMVMDGGNEVPLNHIKEDGFVAVNGVAKKFSLRSGNNTVYVYNEKI